MSFIRFTTSEGFFNCSEPLSSPEISQFDSLRGRGFALLNFFEKLAIVPLAFICKLGKTFFSILGLGLSSLLLISTLCISSLAREFFVKRILILAGDIADWIFWPVSVLFCLSRLLLAATIHPALYYT